MASHDETKEGDVRFCSDNEANEKINNVVDTFVEQLWDNIVAPNLDAENNNLPPDASETERSAWHALTMAKA